MTGESKRARASRIRWVQLGAMQVSPKAQREFRRQHAERLAAEFELEAIGYPVINMRNGTAWILDGQHRVAALRMCGFGDEDQLECEVYENLSEAEEADLFLLRDQRKAISAFDKFRISVTAGHQKQCHIERIVHEAGCRVARSSAPWSISAPKALEFAYGLGSATLARTLTILGRAYDGDRAAFGEHIVKGMALVCQRYNGSLEDEKAVAQLGSLPGGPTALVRKANALQLKTGHTKPHCTAAAIVDTLNSRRGGHKLESWWR